jgi:hypothetical protein
MLEAINIVQPALESFYGGLTDKQKARFNQLDGRWIVPKIQKGSRLDVPGFCFVATPGCCPTATWLRNC